MTLKPTPITAALAGVLTSLVMPALWTRLASDSMWLVLAFLLVVALPAHALVVGFGRDAGAGARTVDVAMLQRVVAWLAAAGVTMLLVRAFSA